MALIETLWKISYHLNMLSHPIKDDDAILILDKDMINIIVAIGGRLSDIVSRI